MNKSTTINKLKGILVDLGIPEDQLREQTLLHEHLGIDSAETVQLSLELKRRLGVDLKIGTRKDMTLAEICNLIESQTERTSQVV